VKWFPSASFSHAFRLIEISGLGTLGGNAAKAPPRKITASADERDDG